MRALRLDCTVDGGLRVALRGYSRVERLGVLDVFGRLALHSLFDFGAGDGLGLLVGRFRLLENLSATLNLGLVAEFRTFGHHTLGLADQGLPSRSSAETCFCGS